MSESINSIISVISLYAVGLLCAGEVLYKGRTSQGKIAWVVSLILMPLLAIPAYFIFGSRKFYGYVEAHKKERVTLQKELNRIKQVIESNKTVKHELSIYEKISKMLITNGNDIEIIDSGKKKYALLFKELEDAKKSILLEYYIISNDEVGKKLRDLLKQKAQQGVGVYLLCDYIGSFSIKQSFINELRQSGVKAYFFRTTKFGRKGQINFRNHRKLVIIDDEVAYTGGMNIAEEYIKDSWNDMHLRIQGPIVSSLQYTFLMDFNWAKREKDILPTIAMDKHRNHPQGYKALAVASGPADDMDTCQLYYLNLISNAKISVDIVSPFFAPDSAILAAIHSALLRGVKVRLIVPKRSDNNYFVDLSTQEYARSLARRGVDVYFYEKGMIHKKLLVADNNLTSVGTANFDNRSFRINFEISILVDSYDFAKSCTQLFENDLNDCEKITGYENRTKLTVFLAKLSQLFGPLQ